jgi:hypothetical protein
MIEAKDPHLVRKAHHTCYVLWLTMTLPLRSAVRQKIAGGFQQAILDIDLKSH